MFKRTGSTEFPDLLKVLLTGEPKAGKTSFLGTVPNILILDTEPFANNLQSVAHLNIPYATITGSADLEQIKLILGEKSLRAQLAESLGMEKIEAVAIDTMDTLQGILKRERMKELHQVKFLRDDWGWLKETMIGIVASFTALPLHVFFTAHTKTKDIGTEQDGRTIVLPGLEGAIAESIAGMVGYSLLNFRKQEVLPDGKAKTSYYLRAEGDETYGFLGNRAAGRLPDIIEPHFKTLLQYAVAGREAIPAPVQPLVQIAVTKAATVTNVTNVTNAVVAGGTPAPAGVIPTQRTASTAAESAPAHVALPADAEPVNPTALPHVKKVYDALGLAFPEALVMTKTLGEARMVVKLWKAIQEDATQGKTTPGSTPQQEMTDNLKAMGFLVGEATPVAAPAAVSPKIDGTIEQVLAYVGDDLGRAQEAYDLESAKEKPRNSLTDKLFTKGAKVHPDRTPDAVQTPVEIPATPAVTPRLTVADAITTAVPAVSAIQAGLGGEVISEEVTGDAPCEQCNNPVDDLDIAALSKTRFGRWLCVNDYIQATKKA